MDNAFSKAGIEHSRKTARIIRRELCYMDRVLEFHDNNRAY